MQGNMLKVSLGFSEFVSQLMYETFDAVMDSQFYQLEKYNDLSEALYMPDDLFKQKYIGNDEFNSFLEKTLGFWPKEGMIIDEKTKSMLVEIIGRDGLDEISKDGNLTGTVLSKLILFCTSKIVEEKKSSLRLFFNQQRNVKLKVEGGEIKTKLELFCLYENFGENEKQQSVSDVNDRLLGEAHFSFKDQALPIRDKKVAIKEINDSETNLRTILVDRNAFVKLEKKIAVIPTARLVANPVGAGSSSNLVSEVSIKFSVG